MGNTLIFILIFTIAFTMNAAYTYINFSDTIKAQWWYIPLGLLFIIVSNVMWMIITKIESSSQSILLKGLLWDVMLTATFILIPTLMLSTRLSIMSIIGLVVAVIGLLIMKIGLL